LRWRLKLYKEVPTFLMEVEIEFHVAGELELKARRPKSVDKYGTWRSPWVEDEDLPNFLKMDSCSAWGARSAWGCTYNFPL